MKKDESGALFIEAAIVLPLFMIAMLSFISLTSLYIVHSKMQYAITQTANETAAYAYFYSYLHLRDVNNEIQDINSSNLESSDRTIGNMVSIINSCSSAMNTISSSVVSGQEGTLTPEELYNNAGTVNQDINDIKDNAEQVENYIQGLLDDPKMVLQWILGYAANSALENGKAALGAYLLYPALTSKYLGYARENGDRTEYLKKMGITNMDFSSSSLLPQVEGNDSLNNRIIDVVVTYDYTLPFSVLPKEASTFHIVQRAVALSWGDGDDSYKYPT